MRYPSFLRLLFKRNLRRPISFGTGVVKYTAKSIVAIPALVMNPMEGTAALLALRNTRKKAQKEIIKGYKSSRKDRKNRRKEKLTIKRAAKGTLLFTGKVAALPFKAVTAPMHYTLKMGLSERGKQIPEFEKQNNKGIQNVKMLENAKEIEENIILGYANLAKRSQGLLGVGDNGISGGLSQNLEARLSQQYDKVVNETLKEVDKQDIEKGVSDYLADTGKKKIQERDLQKILENIQESIDKRANRGEINPDIKPEISVSEANYNVKEALAEQYDRRLAKEVEETLKDNSVREKIDEKAKINIVKDLKKVMATTSDKRDFMKALDKSLENNNIDKNKFDSKTKNEIVDNISRKLKDSGDAVYTAEEIVNVVKKGLNKKDSIKREKLPTDFDFQEVSESLEKLRELNHQYEEKFGEEIFTSEELISAMKKVKTSKKFDLYDSIMNE